MMKQWRGLMALEPGNGIFFKSMLEEFKQKLWVTDFSWMSCLTWSLVSKTVLQIIEINMRVSMFREFWYSHMLYHITYYACQGDGPIIGLVSFTSLLEYCASVALCLIFRYLPVEVDVWKNSCISAAISSLRLFTTIYSRSSAPVALSVFVSFCTVFTFHVSR